MRFVIPFCFILAVACWQLWSSGNSVGPVGANVSTAEPSEIKKTKLADESLKKVVRATASESTNRKMTNLSALSISDRNQIIENVLAQMGKEIEKLDKLPPCEQQKLLKEAVLRHEPSKDCPMARKIYEDIFQGAKRAEEQCLELLGAITKIFESGKTCKSGTPIDGHDPSRLVSNLKIQYQNELLKYLENGIDEVPFEGEFPSAEGEFRDPSCAVMPIVYMLYRKRALSFHAQHFGEVDIGIDDYCNGGYDQPFYLEYIRYGENGNPAISPEQRQAQ